MTVVLIIILGLICLAALKTEQSRARVQKCLSSSCSYNSLGRCTRKEIIIYDNSVKGICAHHTGDMQERILDPLKKGIEIGRKEGEANTLGLVVKAFDGHIEDARLLKDSEKFSKWLKKKIGD